MVPLARWPFSDRILIRFPLTSMAPIASRTTSLPVESSPIWTVPERSGHFRGWRSIRSSIWRNSSPPSLLPSNVDCRAPRSRAAVVSEKRPAHGVLPVHTVGYSSVPWASSLP